MGRISNVKRPSTQCTTQDLTLDVADTTEQKQHFAENPIDYLKYCKEIEDELNQRFKFILNGTPEAAQAKEVGSKL
jgi:cob(I)alamin adenosyltransferase